jgi:glycosyltransferase
VDGVYGDLKYVSAENVDKTIRYWKSSPFAPKKLRQGWMPPHPTLFLKKEVYQQHGSFNTNLKIAADYDFILRIFSDTSLKWAYLPELISIMRVGGASNKSLSNILLKSREDYQALQSNKIRQPWAVLLQKNLRKIPQWLG